MTYIVDFENVSTVGLESSPVAQALAGLRANEARYFKNKYHHVFAVSPASEAPETLDGVNRLLADVRDRYLEQLQSVTHNASAPPASGVDSDPRIGRLSGRFAFRNPEIVPTCRPQGEPLAFACCSVFPPQR